MEKQTKTKKIRETLNRVNHHPKLLIVVTEITQLT